MRRGALLALGLAVLPATAQAAALALPSVEELPPPWAEISSDIRMGQAAE